MSLTKASYSLVNGAPLNVLDFGAKGDGVTDDSAAIQAASDYATANDLTVFFPSGDFYIESPITFLPPCGIECSSRSRITVKDQTVDGVIIGNGNWAGSLLTIPQIVGGKNALLLYGASLSNIRVSNITNALNCITLRIDDTYPGCADNVINFTALSTSNSGILLEMLATSISGTLFQGNQFTGNFIVSCKYGINFYDDNYGALGFPTWDDTQFNIFAIDANNISGSYGIYANADLPPGRCYFNIYGFFDQFDDGYIEGNGIGNVFKLAFSGQPAYAKMKLTGAANRIINVSQGQENWIPAAAIPLATAVNSIATFNGGVPVSANRFLATIAIPAGFVSGTVVTGFFYHPLMTQYMPKITAELWSNQPMRVLWASECSTAGISDPGGNAVYPFQGSVAVIGEGAVAAGNYFVWITVHDAPQ